MALSETVNENLEEAQSYLKNALSFASRQEESYVMVEIAHLIKAIDNIKMMDKIVDTIRDSQKPPF
jgi:hypothetical protein